MAATVDSSHLPIRQFTNDIVKAVEGNDVVVIIGETGSGKTTQLSQVSLWPAFLCSNSRYARQHSLLRLRRMLVFQILLEAGYAKEGLIGVTQPRRVVSAGKAATALSCLLRSTLPQLVPLRPDDMVYCVMMHMLTAMLAACRVL